MQIFVINLDRNPMRWNRMANLLVGLNVRRIAAVDGKSLEGPEYNKPGRQICPEMLSRYNRACMLSHRAVCQEFLSGSDPYCCVLEDDVLISPDFPKFMNGTDWIPADAHVVKIETLGERVWLASKTIACLNRVAKRLRSSHLGTAGYVISRPGAQKILDLTTKPDRSIDRLLFEEDGLIKLRTYQLVPALCIQSSRSGEKLMIPELESTIQPKTPITAAPPRKPVRYPAWNKIQRELSRPFRQLPGFPTWIAMHCRGTHSHRVPFV
jgi:glycosyl transferase family 25